MSEIGHNSGEQAPESQDPDLLHAVQRIANLEQEAEGLRSDINEVIKEAKAKGYDASMVRQLVKDYRADTETVQERERRRRRYLEAIGIPI